MQKPAAMKGERLVISRKVEVLVVMVPSWSSSWGHMAPAQWQWQPQGGGAAESTVAASSAAAKQRPEDGVLALEARTRHLEAQLCDLLKVVGGLEDQLRALGATRGVEADKRQKTFPQEEGSAAAAAAAATEELYEVLGEEEREKEWEETATVGSEEEEGGAPATAAAAFAAAAATALEEVLRAAGGTEGGGGG